MRKYVNKDFIGHRQNDNTTLAVITLLNCSPLLSLGPIFVAVREANSLITLMSKIMRKNPHFLWNYGDT